MQVTFCQCDLVMTWQKELQQRLKGFAHLEISKAGLVGLSRYGSQRRINWPDLGGFDLLSVPKVNEYHAVSWADWVRNVCKLHLSPEINR